MFMAATLRSLRARVFGARIELRLHPWMEIRFHPATDDERVGRPYASSMDAVTTRSLRLLMLAIGVAVVAIGVTQQPDVGVLVSLAGFVVALGGLILGPRLPRRPSLIWLLLLLIASSAALVWLQPGGGGFLGAFVAAGIAANQLPARDSARVAALIVVTIAVASLASGKNPGTLVLLEIGVLAVYAMSLTAGRLRAANAELEATREAHVLAAALGERQRLAREIHDVLAHSLSALSLQLEATKLLARDHGDDEVEDAIERAHGLAKSGLDEARQAVATLRDDELPGPDRIGALAESFEDDAQVPCRVSVAGAPRELAPEARLAVYRVAQEALTNVRRHALPERVDVQLAYERDGVRLAVEDFGTRANGAWNGGGYGLTGMRERAELLGGRLAATPTPSGFRVELWIPA
jgi:signal transduction histidine kinase